MAVGFDNVTLDEAVDIALEHAKNKEKCMVVTPNAEIAQECRHNAELRKIVNDANLVLPDGIGVIYASKILKKPLKQKVAGVEFAEELLNQMQNTGLSVFFFGGKPGVSQQAAENMVRKYPGLKVAGFHSGYFTSERDVVATINEAAPDVLYVCLGAPKQEYFINTHAKELNCYVMAGLGGSIDVMAGVVARAPQIFIKLGLEWFYRLLCQPSRIGRMMKLPLYLFSAVIARFHTHKGE